MSNKNFEDKVLKALWNIEKDVSWLKTDVSWLKQDIARLDSKIDWVESNLNKKIDKLDSKIDWVEYRLNEKIDSQTFELKQEIRVNATYLNQAFNQINKIDREIYMDKHNIKYSYV